MPLLSSQFGKIVYGLLSFAIVLDAELRCKIIDCRCRNGRPFSLQSDVLFGACALYFKRGVLSNR